MTSKQKQNKKDSEPIQKAPIPPMNEELEEWIEESHSTETQTLLKQKQKQKKPRGKCHVCGEKSARTVCIKCGKPVCNSCYIHLLNVCEKCVSKGVADRWKGRREDWEKKLDVDWLD